MFLGLSPGFWLIAVLVLVVLFVVVIHERDMRRRDLERIRRLQARTRLENKWPERVASRRPHH